jgi:DNA-binding LacI/PurR family transcriptional regulator
MNRPVTSHQVAKRAGVSRSTVSLILNDVPGMKFADDTRERVLKAAAELGYVPSAAARSLVSGEARTLGLIICRAEHLLVDAFIPQVLYGMNEVSRQYGYNVLVEGLENIPSDNTYFELIRAKRIDGLIVLNPSEHDTTLPKLIQEGFPIVIFGRDIGADDFKGSQLATQHLLSLGHRRIAHITFAPEDSAAAKHRMAGYRQALQDAGITFDDALVRQGNYDAASGYAAMSALLEQTDFSAVFASNDTVALGAMTAIQQRGLRIPEDIAVVGYDDIPIAAYMYPPLSTVRNFPVKEGKLATKLLIELIRGERTQKAPVVFETPLIIRESCGGRSKT